MSSPFGGEPRSADPYIASSVCGLIISILAIALRFWSRLISKTPIQWDDWAALAALPFALTVVGLTFGAVKENAAMPTPNSPEATIQLFTFAKHFLYMNIVYDFGITFVKLSALLFYFRVFGRTIHSFRIALQVAGISCVLWLFITVITELFMCSLFAPVWILGTPSSQTKCLDTYVLMIGTSAANVVLDIVILVLPHFLLYKLQMGLWKKVGLVGVFICAYSVVAMSLYRLLSTALGTATLATPGLTIAYVLEIPIAIMSVCLPAIVHLGKRWTGTGFMSLFRTEKSAGTAQTPAQSQDIELQKGNFRRIQERSSFS